MNARDGMKRLRDERRDRGICISCGLVKPEPGRMSCRECLDRKKVYSARFKAMHPDRAVSEESRAKYKEAKRRQKEKRRAAGLCVQCGKNKPYGWRVTCYSCLKKRHIADMNRMKKKEKAEGARLPEYTDNPVV